MPGKISVSPAERFENERDFRTYQKHGIDSSRNSSYKESAINVFKNSLIPSVGAISRANSWKEKIWKILMVVLCSVGCTYQVLAFLNYYFSYPTTVMIDEFNPSWIILPAITFCSNNRLSLRNTCESYKNACVSYDADDFCEKYPRYCYPSDKMYRKIPLSDGFPTVENLIRPSWNALFNLSHTSAMIDKCFKIDNGKTTRCEKSDITKVPLTTDINLPAVCYTVGSQIGKYDSENDFYTTALNYQFILNTFQEDYYDLDESVLIYVEVHDSKHVSNPFRDGIALRGGTKYKALVSMTEVLRLPRPYDTNCEDYLSLWRKNGGHGPLNRFECIDQCKYLQLKAEGKCIDHSVSYPHRDGLCALDEASITDEIIENCTRKCSPACYVSTYEVKYLEEGKQGLKCPSKNEGCRLQNIDLTFSFRKFQVRRHIYYPKMMANEVFSSIGSCLLTWLGISLIAVLDTFEMIIKLVYHFLICTARRLC